MKTEGLPNVSWLLMHGRSVRGLQAGRKTQTRRIVKPQPPLGETGLPEHGKILGPEWFEPEVFDRYGESMPGKPIFGIYDEDGEWGTKCPYGAPGDLLYVRETFGCLCHNSMQPFPGCDLLYRATDEYTSDYPLSGWRPSIFMPRWASRITLRLTDVRVERVQEISAEDCIAEGLSTTLRETDAVNDLRDQFVRLWDDTNGPGVWDRNDWVWALTFDVIHANVDDVLADPEKYGIREAA